MRVIEQSAEIQDWSRLDLYERVEIAARVCRRSESKGDAEGFVRSLIRRGHYPPLEFARVEFEGGDSMNVRRIRERAELTALYRGELLSTARRWPAFAEDKPGVMMQLQQTDPDELCPVEPDDEWIPVLFTTSRTISHQLVRYRHDITFCQESQRHCRYDKDGIEVIEPPGLNDEAREYWLSACVRAEAHYRSMMAEGATAEQARAVLPGCTATRILAYASPDEWRHIFSQRCDEHADPQMRALMEPLRARMLERVLI